MITEKDIAIIEAYLGGELPKSEVVAVEERMESDRAFASKVEIVRDMSIALKGDANKFNETLASVMILEEKKVKKIVPFQKLLMVAAAVAGLMVVFFLLNTSDSKNLYSAYFEIPPENIITRNNESGTTLDQAISAYKRSEYEEALSLFDRIEPKSTEVTFYTAICYMAEGNQTRSAQILENLQGTAGSLNSAVDWYLGLSHFQLGHEDEARKVLTKLAETDGYYARRAQDFLAEW